MRRVFALAALVMGATVLPPATALAARPAILRAAPSSCTPGTKVTLRDPVFHSGPVTISAPNLYDEYECPQEGGTFYYETGQRGGEGEVQAEHSILYPISVYVGASGGFYVGGGGFTPYIENAWQWNRISFTGFQYPECYGGRIVAKLSYNVSTGRMEGTAPIPGIIPDPNPPTEGDCTLENAQTFDHDLGNLTNLKAIESVILEESWSQK
jgi:hypothetical protein